MAATLTVSRVEQAAVLRSLELQHGRLPPFHPDSVCLHAVMVRMAHDTTVGMTWQETLCTLRYLRIQHKLMEDDLILLEERRGQGYDGHVDAAHMALDAEAQIVADVLRRLWAMLAM